MPIVINGSGTVTGVTNVGSAAANTAVVMNDSGSNSNTVRAWVNFNGTGTVAIRASFNVSSITDNGIGNYTVNLTNALLDSNFTASTSGDGNPTLWGAIQYEISRTSSTYRFVNVNNQISGSGGDDATTLTATFIR